MHIMPAVLCIVSGVAELCNVCNQSVCLLDVGFDFDGAACSASKPILEARVQVNETPQVMPRATALDTNDMFDEHRSSYQHVLTT